MENTILSNEMRLDKQTMHASWLLARNEELQTLSNGHYGNLIRKFAQRPRAASLHPEPYSLWLLMDIRGRALFIAHSSRPPGRAVTGWPFASERTRGLPFSATRLCKKSDYRRGNARAKTRLPDISRPQFQGRQAALKLGTALHAVTETWSIFWTCFGGRESASVVSGDTLRAGSSSSSRQPAGRRQ